MLKRYLDAAEILFHNWQQAVRALTNAPNQHKQRVHFTLPAFIKGRGALFHAESCV